MGDPRKHAHALEPIARSPNQQDGHHASDVIVTRTAIVNLSDLVYLIRKNLIKPFLFASLPFSILVAIIFPFHHFRYAMVTYPIAMAFVIGNAIPSRSRRPRLRRSGAVSKQFFRGKGLEPKCINGSGTS